MVMMKARSLLLICASHSVSPSQIAIPVVSITNIKKTKTAILVPNALVVATTNDRVREEATASFHDLTK